MLCAATRLQNKCTEIIFSGRTDESMKALLSRVMFLNDYFLPNRLSPSRTAKMERLKLEFARRSTDATDNIDVAR